VRIAPAPFRAGWPCLCVSQPGACDDCPSRPCLAKREPGQGLGAASAGRNASSPAFRGWDGADAPLRQREGLGSYPAWTCPSLSCPFSLSGFGAAGRRRGCHDWGSRRCEAHLRDRAAARRRLVGRASRRDVRGQARGRGTGAADPVYQDPAAFFANTHPARGLRSLLGEALGRATGKRPSAAPIIRLETAFGGGKTHSLIALYHLAASAARPMERYRKGPGLVIRDALAEGKVADAAGGVAETPAADRGRMGP